jgi:hypothetical protein
MSSDSQPQNSRELQGIVSRSLLLAGPKGVIFLAGGWMCLEEFKMKWRELRVCLRSIAICLPLFVAARLLPHDCCRTIVAARLLPHESMCAEILFENSPKNPCPLGVQVVVINET